MPVLKIVTQTKDIEVGSKKTHADDWMDDCAWAAIAAAANYLTGSTHTCRDAIAWGEKVGRHDRDGKGDPTSHAQLIKASPMAGLKARWPRSWDDVITSLKAGAVIGINVEQPRGYPAGLQMSVWHKHHQKRNPKSTYGHMTCAALSPDGTGAQWADPTMSGSGSEKNAVPVSFEGLKAIASSKNDPKGPAARCIIWTPAKPAAVPAPVAPVVPTKPEPRNPAPFDYHAIATPAPSPIRFSGLRAVIARAGARLIGRIAK